MEQNEMDYAIGSQAAEEYESFRRAVLCPAFWRSAGTLTASSVTAINGHAVETLAILAGFGFDGSPNVRLSQKVDGLQVSVGTALALPALLENCAKALGLRE